MTLLPTATDCKDNGKVTNRILQYGGRLYISDVTVGELYTWARRSSTATRRLTEIQEFILIATPLAVTAEVGQKWGELRAHLLDMGKPRPEVDLLIAATAITHGLTLVTHNTVDFRDVPDLHTEDWLAP